MAHKSQQQIIEQILVKQKVSDKLNVIFSFEIKKKRFKQDRGEHVAGLGNQ